MITFLSLRLKMYVGIWPISVIYFVGQIMAANALSGGGIGSRYKKKQSLLNHLVLLYLLLMWKINEVNTVIFGLLG